MFRNHPLIGNKSDLKMTLKLVKGFPDGSVKNPPGLVRYCEAALQGAYPLGIGSGGGRIAPPFSDLCASPDSPGSGFLPPSPVLLSHSQQALDLEINPVYQRDREHHCLPTPLWPAEALLSKDSTQNSLA